MYLNKPANPCKHPMVKQKSTPVKRVEVHTLIYKQARFIDIPAQIGTHILSIGTQMRLWRVFGTWRSSLVGWARGTKHCISCPFPPQPSKKTPPHDVCTININYGIRRKLNTFCDGSM